MARSFLSMFRKIFSASSVLPYSESISAFCFYLSSSCCNFLTYLRVLKSSIFSKAFSAFA